MVISINSDANAICSKVHKALSVLWFLFFLLGICFDSFSEYDI